MSKDREAAINKVVRSLSDLDKLSEKGDKVAGNLSNAIRSLIHVATFGGCFMPQAEGALTRLLENVQEEEKNRIVP